jgi:hypothetical protein
MRAEFLQKWNSTQKESTEIEPLKELEIIEIPDYDSGDSGIVSPRSSTRLNDSEYDSENNSHESVPTTIVEFRATFTPFEDYLFDNISAVWE